MGSAQVIFEIMPDTVASLRQRALECEQKAAWTSDETQRRNFLELARAWRDMAMDYEDLTKRAEPAANPLPDKGEVSGRSRSPAAS
jgi:hypothetical protein